MTCPFCRIAAGEIDAVVVHEDSDIVAFLDIGPIRRGHTQIIPRRHIETFEQLPPELAARIMMLGQQLARRMKAIYGVERVAFLFTGGDVPHAHAHVVPMHDKADITSARYIVEPAELRMSSEHPRSWWASAHCRVPRRMAPRNRVPATSEAKVDRPAPGVRSAGGEES